MSWKPELTEILRVLVNDMEDTPTYTDSTLYRVLIVSAYQVVNDGFTFSQTYAVDVPDQTITPDPTDDDGGNRDDSLINLICLKAACTITRGAATKAAGQAIVAKDGASAIDLRGPLEGHLELLKKGWCEVYKQSKLEYLAGKVRVAGAAVMTPFRVDYGGRDIFLGN